jgi:hypothetical protein
MPGRSSAVFLAAMFGFFFSTFAPFCVSAYTYNTKLGSIEVITPFDYGDSIVSFSSYEATTTQSISGITFEASLYGINNTDERATAGTFLVHLYSSSNGIAADGDLLGSTSVLNATDLFTASMPHGADGCFTGGVVDGDCTKSFNFPSPISVNQGMYVFVLDVQDFDCHSDINSGYSCSSFAKIVLRDGTDAGASVEYAISGGATSTPRFTVISTTDIPPSPEDETSRIISTSPENEYTSPSTSVDLSIAYFASSTDYLPLTQTVLELVDTTAGYSYVFPVNNDPAARGGHVLIGTTTLGVVETSTFYFSGASALTSGHTYLWRISLQYDNYYYNQGALTTRVMRDADNWKVLNVVSSGWQDQIGSTPTTTFALATSTCSIANITGCFQNALVWAFYPSQASFDFLTQQYDGIKNKPPFGLTAYYTAFESIAASSTSAYTLPVPQPYIDNFFSPIRAGLAIMIYMCFSVWFFRRIRSHEL